MASTPEDTHGWMADHMAKRDRRGRAAYLLIALGVGLAAFALVDADPGSEVAVDTSVSQPQGSSPTVLGSTVTAPAVVPTARAATPATFDLPTTTARSPRLRRPTLGAPRTTTTVPPPVIGPPQTIVNTTTTTEAPATTSTTVADTTTTTEAPTTTTDTTAP